MARTDDGSMITLILAARDGYECGVKFAQCMSELARRLETAFAHPPLSEN